MKMTFTLLSSITSITSTNWDGDISFAESTSGMMVDKTSNPNLASRYPRDSCVVINFLFCEGTVDN